MNVHAASNGIVTKSSRGIKHTGPACFSACTSSSPSCSNNLESRNKRQQNWCPPARYTRFTPSPLASFRKLDSSRHSTAIFRQRQVTSARDVPHLKAAGERQTLNPRQTCDTAWSFRHRLHLLLLYVGHLMREHAGSWKGSAGTRRYPERGTTPKLEQNAPV
jgi:hypothetical protein